MNRHCIPGLTMSNSPDGGNFLRECPEQLKRCTQGLARTRIALCQRPGADTGRNRTLHLVKDLCSVLNAQ